MHLVKRWKSEKNLSVLYDGQEDEDDDEGVDSQQEVETITLKCTTRHPTQSCLLNATALFVLDESSQFFASPIVAP